jgi:uncharacterized membrane protein YkoI
MTVVTAYLRAAVLVGLLAGTGGAPAEDAERAWAAPLRADSGEQLPDIGADEAATIARGASGGRVLGVRRVELSGRPIYEVRVLLTGGVVRTMQIDAPSGAIW